MKKIYYLFSLFAMCIGFAVEANAANVTLKAVPHALPAEGGSVTVSDNGTYTGTSTSSGGIFGIGATWSTISHTFTLTATPNDDYEFKGWSESEEVSTLVTGNPYSVTLSQQGANTARTLTKDFYAVFVKKGETLITKYHVPVEVNQSLFNDANFTTKEGTTSWNNTTGITLGDVNGGGFAYDDKSVILHFEGIPDQLTFDIAVPASVGGGLGTLLGGVTDVEWYVQESETEAMPEEKIWNSSYEGTTAQSNTVQLQPSTRYVKICYSGNFGAYVRNIRISERKYLEQPVPETVDFGSAVINAGEVTKEVYINWCNVRPLTVTSSNPRFTVTPTSFGGLEQIGSQNLTISFMHDNRVGEESAVITITNGEDGYMHTISATAVTTRRPQTIDWNAALVATGFAMNVGETFPNAEIEAIAVTPNLGEVLFSSSNPEIISVSEDGLSLTAVAAGTAEITATQAGDEDYEPVWDTKTFVVTELLKQSIVWNQNLLTLLTTDDAVELTATATSGGAITYTSADENVVRIEGNQLIVEGEGETYITAAQAGGEINGSEYLAISADNYVIVRNPDSQCNEMALAVNRLQLEDGSYSQEFELVGVPSSLSFQALHGEKSASWVVIQPNYASLVVEQYARISNLWGWYTVYNNVVGTTETASGSVALDETATKIRFRTTEQETYHTITDIRVPRKKFMRADVEEIYTDVEANTIWSRNITISHSNIDLMTVTTTQGIISLSSSAIGGGCGDFGDDVLTISYTPMDKNVEYFDTIVITDGKADPSTIKIPVHLYTTSLNQSINGFELPESVLFTDEVPAFEATASSGLEVTYFTSNEEIATIVNGNQFKILAAGTVDVIAYQEGDDRYNEVWLTKTIVITRAPQEIEWVNIADTLVVGDYAPVEVFATSGLAVTLESSDYSIVDIIDDYTLYAAAEGEVTITARQDGDNNYLAAEQVSKAVVVRPDISTGIGRLADDRSPAAGKVIRNGMLFIIRDGETYSLLGNRVK